MSFLRSSQVIAGAALAISGFLGCNSVGIDLPQRASTTPSPQPSRGSSPQPSPPPSTERLTAPKDLPVAEEFDFNWLGDGVPAHFKIQQGPAEQRSRLTIHIPYQPDFVLDNDDVWDEFKNDFLREETFLRRHKNLAASKYAYALSPAVSGDIRPLVFLVTAAYGSDPGNLFVLALDSSHHPKLILKTTFHITEFSDLDGDGVSEIAGEPCFSQTWGNDLWTYDPLHVYKLKTTPEPELKLSLPLTQEYNLKHYYGWAGPDCSEELAVVLHPPGGGKPVIMKEKEAERLFEKKK
jgi:hypothetical protein